MAQPTPAADHARENSVRKLLLYLGSAMVGGGQAVYEVEEEVIRVARVLGYPNAQVSATPTGVTVSLASGEPSALEMSPRPMALGQSTALNDIRRRILNHELGIAPALAELSALRAAKLRYGRIATYGGGALVATGLCLILQPVWTNVLLVALLSLPVSGILKLSERYPSLKVLAPSLAAFIVAMLCFTASEFHLIDGPLRTLICPLVVFLPGGTMATGMAELAGGSMIAGSSRFFYGIVQLMMLGLGLQAANLVVEPPMSALMNVRFADIGPLATPMGILLLALGIALTEALPWRLMPWMLTLIGLTYVAQAVGQAISGQGGVGVFLGAMTASFGAAMMSMIRANVPRLVVFTPSFWLLVPGALGLIGITTLATSLEPGLTLIQAVTVTLAVASGLLVGSTLARPWHRWMRRRRAAARHRTPEEDSPRT